MIVCAGGNENFDFAKAIGVGLVESAINLTQFCLMYRPKDILFIGTCGIYDKGEILELYESFHAFNVEFAKLSHNFYTPAKSEIFISSQGYRVNSSNYICNDSKAAKKFANLGLHFENMEAFAVLSVAKKFGISAKCLLCATNFCDENAHENFTKNHQKAKEKLVCYLKNNCYI
ncbi:purine-nucleoside phosphorylase [Campylobacter sp.]|uniref:phosphorylase family protein n=1 Tax=Campylobacter sp. TaxID=205 RepID=UPI0026DC826D|nr:purine-nucleoside phosphorylase [Campylobacter sp.]MDO4674422.1 purine-nucleoside phosphorylase [Campylobacter sp.]